jgi:hypothetical protein
VLLPLLLLLGVPQFHDRASEAGLDVVTYCGGAAKNHILESTGNGVLVFDYDQDGDLDIYFVNAYRFLPSGGEEVHSSVLYHNRGDGTFENVTARAGVETAVFGQGGAVGDVDGDGLPDVYVTAFGEDLLFRNNGDGTFSDWTMRAGLGLSGWSIGASFFDADADGDQDLFVARYIDTSWEQVRSGRRTRRWRGKVDVLDGPRGLTGATNAYYVNQGDGTFAEATVESGFDVGSDFYSMSVLTVDYDLDGDIDLYVANDSTPNCLYRNRGDGTFEEVGAEAGVAFSADGLAQGSMGLDAGDVDGDGFFDLVVTNFAHDYYSLYRNLGGKLFLDDSFDKGIALTSFAPLGWGALFLDVDHDADLDLFFSNGQIYPQVDDDPSLGETYAQPNQLLLWEDARFMDVSDSLGPGLSIVLPSRGAAYGDFDGDGDLDIVVSNEDAAPSYLVNDDDGGGHWVSFELVGGGGDRLALGARVGIEAGGRHQLRQVVSGGSYASQNDMRLHFGLGESRLIDVVTIVWPGGSTENYRELAADARYVLKQGQEPVAAR